VLLALPAALIGCGGGFVVGPGFFLSVNTRVDGVPVGGPIAPGSAVTITLAPGQSVQLDANESVTWRYAINGGPAQSGNSTVVVGGVSITQQVLSTSAAQVTTAVVGPTTLPIVITWTATSTFDAAQVSTAILRIQ
jgi:hypothetical protein